MVKLPDYRAQRRLNPGSAPQVSVDRSGLAQMAQMGNAVQGAGEDALRAMGRHHERDRQKEDFTAKQHYAQMNTMIEQDRVSLLEQSPEDGTGFTAGFMNEALSKRQAEFFGKIPERLHEDYGLQLQTDTMKWDGVARQNELDKLHANTATVIGEQSNELLNSISLDANQYEEALASGLSLIDASPLPPSKKAEAKRDWEDAAVAALAQKLIADDPEAAQKALGGGSEATQIGGWLQGFLQSESGGNWNAWFGNAGNKEDLSKLSLGQILKRQDEPGNDAAGLIQIVPGTLRNVMGKYGYSADTKFTPQVQAEMALLLMREKGLNKWLAGDMSDEKFANGVATVWAGLKQSNGRGAYDGDGVNKGSQSHGVTVDQLQGLRGLVQKDDKLRAWLANPKGAGAPAIAAGGGQIAEVFQGMDYGARLTALNYAEKGLADQQSTLISEMAALKGSIQLQIARDDPNLTAQQILESPLKDSDKASLINSYEAARKEQREASAFAVRLQNGDDFDPYSTDDKNGVDSLYSRVADGISVLDDQNAQALTRDIYQRTGIVPKSALNQIRRGLGSTDPQQAAAAGALAASLQSDRPNEPGLLGARNGGSELEKAATKYRHFTEVLGYTPEDAGKHLADMNDPQKRREREALLETKAVKEAVSKIDEAHIRNVFDNEYVGFDPEIGRNETGKALALAEYRELYRQAIVEANGDQELAESLANEQFKRVYGTSKLSETNGQKIIRHPAETVYPPIGGSHDWIREQLTDELTKAGLFDDETATVADGDGRRTRGPAGALRPNLAKRVFMEPSPETEADIRAGRIPTYQVYYEKNGQIHQYHGLFHPDYKEARAASILESEGRRQDNMADHEARRGDPVQGVFDDAARQDSRGKKAELLDGFAAEGAN